MWASSNMNILIDQYRVADGYGDYQVAHVPGTHAGYFRFGKNAVCYGRTSEGFLQSDASDKLYDVLQDVRFEQNDFVLPFDPGDVIDNLRNERYMRRDGHTLRQAVTAAARKTYYTMRPLMPVPLRKRLQRMYLKDWSGISFPDWPVDRTVENVFEELIKLSLQSHHVARLPFIWFWPDGYSACSI